MLFKLQHNSFLLVEHAYDVTPDGQRFIVMKPVEPPPTQINVVTGWMDELRQRVPWQARGEGRGDGRSGSSSVVPGNQRALDSPVETLVRAVGRPSWPNASDIRFRYFFPPSLPSRSLRWKRPASEPVWQPSRRASVRLGPCEHRPTFRSALDRRGGHLIGSGVSHGVGARGLLPLASPNTPSSARRRPCAGRGTSRCVCETQVWARLMVQSRRCGSKARSRSPGLETLAGGPGAPHQLL